MILYKPSINNESKLELVFKLKTPLGLHCLAGFLLELCHHCVSALQVYFQAINAAQPLLCVLHNSEVNVQLITPTPISHRGRILQQILNPVIYLSYGLHCALVGENIVAICAVRTKLHRPPHSRRW